MNLPASTSNAIASSHGALLREPLNESMGKAVMQWLQAHAQVQLPPKGLLAGQSVCTALLALYGADPNRQGPLNDVDVFWSRRDGLLESGWVDMADPGTFWMRQHDEAYDQIFARKICITSGFKVGQLNMIEQLIPSQSDLRLSGPDAISDQDRLELTLSDFDLSCVEVGIDLATGKMSWTREFAECMTGKPVVASAVAVPERTWLRALKKSGEMPWLNFDLTQILSTVQMHQAHAYLQLKPSGNLDKCLAGWREHHESLLMELDAHQLLKPMWRNDVWPLSSDSHQRAHAVRSMHLSLTQDDAAVLKAMLAPYPALSKTPPADDVDDFSPNNLSGLHAFPKLTQSSSFSIGGLPLPQRGEILISHGTPEEFDEYLQREGDALFAENVKPRKEASANLVAAVCCARGPRFMGILLKHVRGRKVLDAKGFADCFALIGARPTDEAIWYAEALLSMTHEIKDSAKQPMFHRVLQALNRKEHLMNWWVEKGLPGDRLDQFGCSASDILWWIKVKSEFNTDDTPSKMSQEPVAQSWLLPHLTEGGLERSKDKMTFMRAIDSGDVQKARELIQGGMNPNHCARPNDFPLIAATHALNSTDMLEMLLKEGADPDVSELIGSTALMVAARQNRHAHLRMLIDAGCDIQLQNKDGSSALDFACKAGNLMCVKILLDAGASTHSADRGEMSPMDNALLYNRAAIVAEFLQRAEPGQQQERVMRRIEQLIEATDTITAETRSEVQALMQAMRARDQMQAILATVSVSRRIA